MESETSSEGGGYKEPIHGVCDAEHLHVVTTPVFFLLSPPLLISDLFTSSTSSSSSCRNMVKSFYTSSLLLDVLSVFGELSEEVRSQTIQKDKQMS